MIGQLPEGAIPGVVITAVSHEGLSVLVDGQPGQLAIIDANGKIVAAGLAVAREAEAVAINSFKNVLQGQGFLRVIGSPLGPDPRCPEAPAL